jgi:hypothetical protein
VGQITLTPSNPVFFSASGQSCTLTFNVQVASNATPQTITQAFGWAGTCNIDGASAAGGATGSDFFSIQSCSVALDKQVSCDGGLSWHDVSLVQAGETLDDSGNASTISCTGFTGDPILVRYVVNNTGTVDLDSCTLTDSNTVAIPTPPTVTSPLPVGGTFDSGTGVSATCNATNSAGEPDTAGVSCACAGAPVSFPPVTASDTASFACESCSVAVDKQVTCQGTTYDVTCTGPNTPPGCDPNNCVNPTDPTCLQSSACIGFDAYCSDGSPASCSISGTPPVQTCTCTPPATLMANAQNIGVAYALTNTGQDTITCTGSDPLNPSGTLGLTDTNVLVSSTSNPPEGSVNTTFTSGQSQTINATDPCNPALNTAETNGDTAALKCTCAPLNNNEKVVDVSATDSALFACQQPALQLSKTCAPQASGTSLVTVTASNSGGANFTGCAVTDAYDTDVSCPQTPPGANSVSLTPDVSNPGLDPASFPLNASGSAKFDGSISGLTANACNLASVTCNVGATQITASAQATCPVTKGCETRTPGFWKNRPGLSQEVITGAGGFVKSCGLELDNTLAAPSDCSTTVDMCQLGTVAHDLNIDPVQSNLIFQCAAAALNLAVTTQDGGSCGTTLPGSDLTFDQCCGDLGTCATGDLLTLNACQMAVSNFNAMFENCPDPSNPLCTSSSTLLSSPGPANPNACQSTRKTGDFVNDAAGLGASTPVPDCSDSGRLYLTKTTGKNH